MKMISKDQLLDTAHLVIPPSLYVVPDPGHGETGLEEQVESPGRKELKHGR